MVFTFADGFIRKTQRRYRSSPRSFRLAPRKCVQTPNNVKITHSINGEFCDMKISHCVDKFAWCFEYPRNLFICDANKLERIEEGSIKKVVSVDLRSADFVPGFATTGLDWSMYSCGLVDTATSEKSQQSLAEINVCLHPADIRYSPFGLQDRPLTGPL